MTKRKKRRRDIESKRKSLELRKCSVLYKYWRDAENTEQKNLLFFFGSIILPATLAIQLSQLALWVLVIGLVIYAITSWQRRTFYVKKQEEIRRIIEKLEV